MTTTSQLSSLACPPRYGTPRNLDRPTLGFAVDATARLLGKPLMPWQRHVADVAMELDPDTGRLAYREANLTVPRQSGKTQLLLSKNVQRAMATKHFGPRQRIVYTAQTLIDAREKWELEFVAALEACPALRGKFTVRRANGSERITFANGSIFGIDANTQTSGHGSTLDTADIDEAFAQVDDRSEQAMRPSMITRPQPQLWVVSTGGWLGGSPYLWNKVQTGRDQIETGENTRRCYFEWSAPQDADPGDRDVWTACMPGLECNGGIIPIEAIEDAYAAFAAKGALNGFRRAYLNQWVPEDSPTSWAVISQQVWNDSNQPSKGVLSPIAFGVHVLPDRSATIIAVAGRRTDGFTQIEVVASQSGTDWALPWLIERHARWSPVAIILDGTALALEATLADADIVATPTHSGVRAQATVDFYDAVQAGEVRHTGDPALVTAVETAVKRPMGDRWVWDGPVVGPLVAVTLAHYGLLIDRPVTPPAVPRLAAPDPDSRGTVTRSDALDLSTIGF